MVIKTSDKKRDDIFFKAISSVLDRDGLLIDFRGGWFKWYGGYIESQHFWGDTKEKIGSSRLIEISDWHNYREFDDLFCPLILKIKTLSWCYPKNFILKMDGIFLLSVWESF